MVGIKIRNDIRLNNLPKDVFKTIKKELTITNPDYAKKIRMGFWVGNTPKTLNLYTTIDNDLIIPYGMKTNVRTIFDEQGISYGIDEKHASKPIKINIKEPTNLYDYQREAVEEVLKHDNGMLISPAGSGKTRMAMEIIGKRSVKTLWITHTLDLLRQSKRVFKTHFNNKVGQIASGKINIQEVTFATVQTLNNIDLNTLKDEFEMIIVDEAHRATGSPSRIMMFYKVITSLNAKYKYGLTATLYDKPNDISSTPLYLLGNKLHEVDQEDIVRVTAEHKVIDLPTAESDMYLNPDRTINFHELVNYLVYDMHRNTLIVDNLLQNKDRHNIILSNRNAHLEIIAEMLEFHGIECRVLIGEVKSSDREEILNDFGNGEYRFLLSNYQLAKEGLDLPIADTLHLIFPMRDRTTLVQSKGRVERNYKGKTNSIVYDYLDTNIGTLQGMFKTRRRWLR